MNTEPNIDVRVRKHFEASPERVFDAWLDAATARKWLFATPAGEMVRAEIDPRVGGKFTFTDRREGEEAEHTGEYLVIDRPRRLVFTFSAGDTEPSRISVDIVPQGSGCELTLSHEMKPEWAEYKERTEQGWAAILDGLAATLGEGGA